MVLTVVNILYVMKYVITAENFNIFIFLYTFPCISCYCGANVLLWPYLTIVMF